MSQRIMPAKEVLCSTCLRPSFDDANCVTCEKLVEPVVIRSDADLERLRPALEVFEDEDAGDYGRDRVYTEEALTKLSLRAIAGGALCPERIAAAMLAILDEKAMRLYG